ncbi:MAG: fatty acid desaturase [Microthrixaceae bacterium]
MTGTTAEAIDATLTPDARDLPDVLPTADLGSGGRPLGALRERLYRRHDLRNACNVVSVWVQTLGVVVVALWLHHPLAWVAAFVLMSRGSLFAILTHEAAHRLLFSNRRLNDFVGTYLLGAPGFVPLDAYRRGHMAHHREEFGPTEPDMSLYVGYPVTRASWHRKLRRDAFGPSGWKLLKGLLHALGKRSSRPVAVRLVGAQLVLAVGFAVVGYPLAWPLLWLAPWMTGWRVINRLRAVAEHGGAQRSPDRRLTTHHVEQSWSARFWIVPFNTGWHLAHHVDIGVPFQNLPRLHHELVAAGWVTPGYVYPSYRSFWKAASSRAEGAAS